MPAAESVMEEIQQPVKFVAVLVATLVPVVLGMVWYSPIAFLKPWLKSVNMTEEQMKQSSMVKMMIGSVIIAFFLSATLAYSGIIVHQLGLMSLFIAKFQAGDSGAIATYKQLVESLGMAHRSFGHGFFHGAMFGIFGLIPVVTSGAIYEQKGFKYVLIVGGYWAISSALMGGIISVWV